MTTSEQGNGGAIDGFSVLKPGEERSYSAHGITTRIFYVANGSFTRVDTRRPHAEIAGRMVPMFDFSTTQMFCSDALKTFRLAVAYIDTFSEGITP